MAKRIVTKILAPLSSFLAIPFMKEILIFLFSASPFMESRGGLIAASILHMDPVESFIICMLGNILPIPLILLFFDKVLDWMRKGRLKKFARRLDKKVEKNRTKVDKYGYVGLLFFVAIPMPGTGAWTACLVASALKLEKKKSFLYTALGVLMASVIMMYLTFGLLSRYV